MARSTKPAAGKRQRKCFSLGSVAVDSIDSIRSRSTARDASDAVTRALIFYALVLDRRVRGSRLLFDRGGVVTEAILIEPMGDAS